MEEIEVSVFCTAYNHEKYIRQCLEGFVMQKTNFPFEVIVHDDASTDKTPEIIKEYADKYPNIIKPICQKENQYSKGVSVIMECCYPKAKGKYLAWCEGDDFWIDENKLQIQYDIMEKNPNCHLCLHKVRAISENGKELNITYPNFDLEEKIMNCKEFFKIIYKEHQFHTCCFFLKTKDYKNYISNFVEIRQIYRKCEIGDEAIILYFGQLDGIYYINKIMSKYRKNSIGSYSLRIQQSSKEHIVFRFYNFIKATEEFDKYTSYKYHDIFILRMLSYSVSIAKNHPNRKKLLFRDRKKFFGRFNLFQKIGLLMVVLFPTLTTILYKIFIKFYRIFKC